MAQKTSKPDTELCTKWCNSTCPKHRGQLAEQAAHPGPALPAQMVPASPLPAHPPGPALPPRMMPPEVVAEFALPIENDPDHPGLVRVAASTTVDKHTALPTDFPAARSPEEQFAECERVITGGLKTFIETGEALAWISEARLYLLGGYQTFADYCERRWDMSKSRAYQLISAAEVVAALPAGGPVPSNEAQARELAQVPDPEERAAAWQEAVQESGGKPTAAQVKEKAAPRSRKVTDRPTPAATAAKPAASADAMEAGPKESSADLPAPAAVTVSDGQQAPPPFQLMRMIEDAGKACEGASDALDAVSVPPADRKMIETAGYVAASHARALIKSATGKDLLPALPIADAVALEALQKQVPKLEEQITRLSQEKDELLDLAETKKRELYCSGCGEEKTCPACGIEKEEK
jgi:hypothetical protein